MDASARALTILVVEDEILVRELSVGELKDAGFEVAEAGSAGEALGVLETGAAIAVLFTDVNMPGQLDGLGLAHLVHERWPDVRLIVTSGGEKVGLADLPDKGRFIAKPFSLSAMRILVSQAAGDRN
jgi:DNA-binding NtrC family response regulator